MLLYKIVLSGLFLTSMPVCLLGCGTASQTSVPRSCSFDGMTVESGSSVVGYGVSSVPANETCSSVAVTVSCEDGGLSPVNASRTCAVAGAPRSCTFNGSTLAAGDSVEGYSASTVPSGQSCFRVSESVTCTNGVLSPADAFASCASSGASGSCFFNGATIPNGGTAAGYSVASVASGASCDSVAETVTCTSGVLSPANAFPGCSVVSHDAPGAPTNVKAFATMEGAYVLFAPPANVGSSALTKYTATTSTGQSVSVTPTRIQNEDNTLSYMQLNCRADITSLSAGVAFTVTVTASNSSGEGPASAPSNEVTPTAHTRLFVADGAGTTAESPAWGDYSYSGEVLYGVAPGAPSSNGTGGYHAPSNPIDPSYKVVEFDNPNDNGGWQPFFHHENPNNTQNGRLDLAPFTEIDISVWPTANQSALQQALYIGVLKCLWVNGAVGSGGGNSLSDPTQSWPPNIFVGALLTDITTDSLVGITSNTATTLTLARSVDFAAGDLYEISIPDVTIGQHLTVGGGTATGYGPTRLVSGEWNTYAIPLTAFDGGTTTYPTVAGGQILKFQVAMNSNATEVHYFANVGFN